jgi:hypothetical protein
MQVLGWVGGRVVVACFSAHKAWAKCKAWLPWQGRVSCRLQWHAVLAAHRYAHLAFQLQEERSLQQGLFSRPPTCAAKDPCWLCTVAETPSPGLANPLPPQVPKPDLRLTLNITQPLMPESGQLRWAINNVAHQQVCVFACWWRVGMQSVVLVLLLFQRGVGRVAAARCAPSCSTLALAPQPTPCQPLLDLVWK